MNVSVITSNTNASANLDSGLAELITCISCQKRKVKCDGTKPSCSNCLRRKDDCNYRRSIRYKKIPLKKNPVKKQIKTPVINKIAPISQSKSNPSVESNLYNFEKFQASDSYKNYYCPTTLSCSASAENTKHSKKELSMENTHDLSDYSTVKYTESSSEESELYVFSCDTKNLQNVQNFKKEFDTTKIYTCKASPDFKNTIFYQNKNDRYNTTQIQPSDNVGVCLNSESGPNLCVFPVKKRKLNGCALPPPDINITGECASKKQRCKPLIPISFLIN
ncbi:hypothetical protein BB559_005660 [Furculomyces boomerangus]|uniref:Zn(2)-C6 fungal-type domain-containing protein n=1 Tax=Furculomyces boomerangus TaxID=61424 RepID=A0A2T9Y7B3_9FUNG|nr:hypothetical protein BB559_005660 [Furculomyces boomerangus]